MANLLQSSQKKSTCAPDYYAKCYLPNIVSKGNAALAGTGYVGATGLQNKAFCAAANNAGAAKPAFQSGLSAVGCAANKDICGAATPYFEQAAGSNTGQIAQCYMSPYINSVLQNMSNVAQRNIDTNLNPQTQAGLVGSGQFGSQRGAQVMGQVEANALQCLNAKMGCVVNQGYGTAMQAATARQNLLSGLGTAAGNVASECARAKTAAGAAAGTLGSQLTQSNIACECAVAKLGEQCRMLQQNAKCYALSEVGKYAGLMNGANVPTNVKTTMCMSPLSAVGAVTAGGLGVLCKIGANSCFLKNIKKGLCFGGGGGGACGVGGDGGCNPCNVYCQPDPCSPCVCNPGTPNACCTPATTFPINIGGCCYAKGGQVKSKHLRMMGCGTLRVHGALPTRK
jgi:hypothetical protein